jgi:hypothetical protein
MLRGNSAQRRHDWSTLRFRFLVCLQPPDADSVKTDISSATATAFIEDIKLNQRVSDDLHRWVSVETLHSCEALFRHHKSDAEFSVFWSEFHRKKSLSKVPSRL